MKTILPFNGRKFLLSIATAALLSGTANADCTYELFNIASIKGTTVGEFIDQISDECSMSVIVADSEAENILKKPMNKTYLKNLTINEVLDLIIKENSLQYTLSNNILKISYLQTKTYNIDYIISQRIGIGNTNVTLSSNSSTSNNAATGATGGTSTTAVSEESGASSMSGMNITSNDEVRFWEALDKEIQSVLNRPEDTYTSKEPTINKNAGLVTVTATGNQLARLDAYLENMQKKMHTQVLIDVKMYGVIFNDTKTTGVDWNQIWAFQNGTLAFDTTATSGVAPGMSLTPSGGFATSGTSSGKQASVFQLSVGGSINNLVKFLETQGDVYAISNPKIMTLNNQAALITAGTELFYRTINTSTLAGGTTGEQATSEVINSVFAGVLLDITPEISKDGAITLRINPSLSEPASQVSTDGAVRTMPPDLTRRQISSVVTIQDGGRVVLGGLINVKNVDDSSYVPILGDIPILSYLFKREGMIKKTEEIVMIIEPHIVKKEGDNITLGDLGFSRITNAMEKEKFEQSLIIKEEQDTLKEMKEDAK